MISIKLICHKFRITYSYKTSNRNGFSEMFVIFEALSSSPLRELFLCDVGADELGDIDFRQKL